MAISGAQYRSAMLRQHFGLFLRFAFRALEPEKPYLHNWHIDAIAHELDRVLRGDNRYLAVTMPPRHLKSITVSVAWVAWMLGNNPALNFMCVSYGMELAEKHARQCLQLIQSPWFAAAFPDLHLTKRTILDFETSRGGGRLSSSFDGGITGRGADIIIVDDPMKAVDIFSEGQRTAATTKFYNSLVHRHNDAARGAIIVVMQRLHEADLVGEIIERGGWHELRLPAIAAEDEHIRIGWQADAIHVRAEGEPLHPQRLSLDDLRRIEGRDPNAFASQFLQDPIPATGNWVKAASFLRYETPPTGGVVVMSLDTACKEGLNTDFSVAIIARYMSGRYYILDVYRERGDVFGLRAAIERLCRHYRVEQLLIEDKSSGTQLITMLRRERQLSWMPNPTACKAVESKQVRFYAQAGSIRRGDVVLPHDAPWVDSLLTELLRFPNGRHDDQADALAQMLANRPTDVMSTLAGPEIIDPNEPYYPLNSDGTINEALLDDPWV